MIAPGSIARRFARLVKVILSTYLLRRPVIVVVLVPSFFLKRLLDAPELIALILLALALSRGHQRCRFARKVKVDILTLSAVISAQCLLIEGYDFVSRGFV